MGVPGLWPFIAEYFKKAVKPIQHVTSSRQGTQYVEYFDYVYIDANALLHEQAQIVEGYGNHESMLPNEFSNLSPRLRQRKIFEFFVDSIVERVKIIIPKKVLYIAIDGSAPRAKQAQQRERRFVSAIQRLEKEAIAEHELFNSSVITPGTEFMGELAKFLHYKIRLMLEKRDVSRSVEIVFSPPTVPGEGEHKLLSYIRNLPLKERNNASHCMFGPDGDLLVLTLSAHVKNMSLFRDDQDKVGWFHLVNMNIVRSELKNKLGQLTNVRSGKRTDDDVSNDFVFLGFFLGNDFLPKIKMFYRLKDGLNLMFDTFVSKIADKGITKGLNINSTSFLEFVEELSALEEEEISKQAIIDPPINNITKKPDLKFYDVTLMKNSTVVTSGNGEKMISSINMKNFRVDYYSKFGIVERLEEGVNSVCFDYIKSLIWVYRYYTNSLPSWDWAYRWHYAPLMCDLETFLKEHKSLIEKIEFELNEPSLPFEQLLSVLPPTSCKLLPKHFRPLMTNEDSILVKAGYYPTSFMIDYEGKRKDYQGVALLSFTDFKIVKKAYNEYNNTYKYKYHRNEFGKNYAFNWTPKGHLVDFVSEYGKIVDCRVKVSEFGAKQQESKPIEEEEIIIIGK